MTKTNARTTRKARPAQPIKVATLPAAKIVPTAVTQKNTPALKADKAKTLQPSKQDRVLGLLRRKEGATVSAIMKATGWQQHSVRGFLAGVVRKKLKLHLTSRDDDGKRVYRIAGGRPPKSAGRAAR